MSIVYQALKEQVEKQRLHDEDALKRSGISVNMDYSIVLVTFFPPPNPFKPYNQVPSKTSAIPMAFGKAWNSDTVLDAALKVWRKRHGDLPSMARLEAQIVNDTKTNPVFHEVIRNSENDLMFRLKADLKPDPKTFDIQAFFNTDISDEANVISVDLAPWIADNNVDAAFVRRLSEQKSCIPGRQMARWFADNGNDEMFKAYWSMQSFIKLSVDPQATAQWAYAMEEKELSSNLTDTTVTLPK